MRYAKLPFERFTGGFVSKKRTVDEYAYAEGIRPEEFIYRPVNRLSNFLIGKLLREDKLQRFPKAKEQLQKIARRRGIDDHSF